MKALALALFLAALYCCPAGASSLPSCEKFWKNQKYEFDFREPYGHFQERLRRSQCEKDWTVLVYMAADNNLFPYALWNLYEMEASFERPGIAGSTLKTDLVVQLDGPAPDDLRRLHIFSGPVRYEEKTKDDFLNASPDIIKSPVVERIPENARQSEQQRFETFLAWAAKHYPARNFMVVVWGHGQGWKSFPVQDPAKSKLLDPRNLPRFPSPTSDESFGGIAFRQSGNSWLDIPSLNAALGSFRKLLGRPIDVYASDACLMQMLEVGYELGSNARFIVGSAQVQSYLGLPYRRILYELNTGRFNGLRKENKPGIDGSDEPFLLAKMIPTLMKASLNPKGGGLHSHPDREAIQSVTSSALTMGEVEAFLVPGLEKLGKAIKSYLLEDPSRKLELRYVTQNIPTFQGSAQDFGVFLGFLDQLILEERNKTGILSPAASVLRSSISDTKNALDRSVLNYAYGSSYAVDEKTQLMGYVPRAVSLWLPANNTEYKKRRDEFAASRLYRETRWQDWLDALFSP